MGLFVRLVPVPVTSPAVPGSALPHTTELDRVSCQGCSLETLGYSVCDPGPATGREHNDSEHEGRITRDGSDLRGTQAHLQNHSTGHVSAAALWLPGQAEVGRLAQGRPPPPDPVQAAVWASQRHVTVHQRSSVTQRWRNRSSGLGCGNKTDWGGRAEDVRGEEPSRWKGTRLLHLNTSCPHSSSAVLGRHDPPYKVSVPSGHTSGILCGGVSPPRYCRVSTDYSQINRVWRPRWPWAGKHTLRWLIFCLRLTKVYEFRFFILTFDFSGSALHSQPPPVLCAGCCERGLRIRDAPVLPGRIWIKYVPDSCCSHLTCASGPDVVWNRHASSVPLGGATSSETAAK